MRVFVFIPMKYICMYVRLKTVPIPSLTPQRTFRRLFTILSLLLNSLKHEFKLYQNCIWQKQNLPSILLFRRAYLKNLSTQSAVSFSPHQMCENYLLSSSIASSEDLGYNKIGLCSSCPCKCI